MCNMVEKGHFFDCCPCIENELFETLSVLGNGNVKIERIVSMGHTYPTDGSYCTQCHDEWVIVLEGEALLDCDGNLTRLQKGDWLKIPSGLAHRVTQSSKPCFWLAVHFYP